MTPGGLSLFDTAIGRCGIAWRDGVVVAVQLPEADDRATRARLMRRAGGAVGPGAGEAPPPPEVQPAIDGIVAHLRGELHDFTNVDLDLRGVPAFDRRVYDVTRAIPRGTTRSYGDVAVSVGEASAAVEVGRALARNPFPIIVPCHRVLAAGGRIGGFSAHGGVSTKLRILAIEDAVAASPPTLFDG